MKTSKIGGFILLSIACFVLLSVGIVFAMAKAEKPLNNIHREAVVCSLEYTQTNQATLITQVNQYNQLELRRINGENTGPAELSLLSAMQEETGILSTCGSDTVPPNVQSFMTAHGKE